MKLTIYILSKEDSDKIKDSKENELDLQHSILSKTCITKLFQALSANSSIKKLKFNSVRFIDDDTRMHFINELQNNKTISELNIQDTPELIEETGDMQFPITDILAKNNSIQHLWVGHKTNPLMHALILRLFANKNLLSLHMQHVSLTIEGVRGMSQNLKNNLSLTKLEIQQFSINNQAGEGEVCANLFKQGIAENKGLKKIILPNIKFSHDNNEKLVSIILEEAGRKDSTVTVKHYSSSPSFWKQTRTLSNKAALPPPLPLIP